MDVKNNGRDENFDEQPLYILTADDVENILVATDALYCTILQNLRGRDHPIQVNRPSVTKGAQMFDGHYRPV